MPSGIARAWLSLVSIVVVLWGAAFAVFGFTILPVERGVLLDWESAIYDLVLFAVPLLGCARRNNPKRHLTPP